jgi:hypothetical protein
LSRPADATWHMVRVRVRVRGRGRASARVSVTWHMDDSKPSCAMCALSSMAASSKALPKLLRPG